MKIPFLILICLLKIAYLGIAQKSVNGTITMFDGSIVNSKLCMDNASMYSQISVCDSGSVTKYTAFDIAAYQIGKRNFKALVLRRKDENGEGKAFFIEELERGAAELYYYPGNELQNKAIYLFRKQNEKAFYSVEQECNQVKTIDFGSFQQPSMNGSVAVIMPISFKDETPFLLYFKNYFSDCTLVFNKFRQNLYNFNDLEAIFKDYNRCKPLP